MRNKKNTSGLTKTIGILSLVSALSMADCNNKDDTLSARCVNGDLTILALENGDSENSVLFFITENRHKNYIGTIRADYFKLGTYFYCDNNKKLVIDNDQVYLMEE